MHSPLVPSFPFFGQPNHHLQLYSDDDVLMDTTEKLLRDALERGEGTVCFATRTHLDALANRFQERSPGIARATEERRYLTYDVTEVTNSISNGRFDELCICEILNQAIRNAATTGGGGGENRVAVFAETAARLWAAGKRDDALQWECLWNRLSVDNPISVRCAYPIREFEAMNECEYAQLIVEEHGALIGPSSYAPASTQNALEQVLAEERRLIDCAAINYPKWQPRYRDAVRESDASLLFEKLESALAQVLTRLHELRTITNRYDERCELIRAWRILQIIKHEELGFVD